MTTTNLNTQNDTLELQVKKTLPLLPVYVLVPVLFWVVFHYSGTPLVWAAFGLGALGWIIALMLRGPVSAVAMRLPKEKAQQIVVGSSGPLEEGVRLGLLLLTGSGFSWALSIGQGWAAVEVLYTMVQVVAIASLAKRTDEKALQAKAMLEAQGTVNASPVWGIVERISASAFHIGCTLLAAANPWLVFVLIPLHSAVNLTAVRLAKKSLAMMELVIAIVGLAALVIGLLAHS
ncbi:MULTISPECIES: hypothetical protein [Paenibacillus]|uniref:hypothetical protein n=1 Tax=Paenibacillus TaxID=44249 RepID=UPI0008396D54|nr:MULTISPECIES: hypothetical protein [Paenibacillus]GIP24281.1 hypothetical protein J22TS3_45560 [Paenibacillus sp. J22TS3]